MSTMLLLNLQEQLTLLHNLIEKGATGTPHELALKLGVAERTARSYIEQLRAMGATICYCRTRQTYYYCSPVVFKFGYEMETAETHGEGLKRGGGKPLITWRIRHLFFTNSAGARVL
jgi:hypothetical protein